MMTKTVPFLAAVLVALSGGTSMATSGDLTITTSLTLTEDHYGSITIGADNVVLDCAQHAIIRDTSLPGGNCPALSPYSTCGVAANGRKYANVLNCTIVGNYGAGVWLSNTKWPLINNSTLNGNMTGIYVSGGDHIRLTYDHAMNGSSGFVVIGAQEYVLAYYLIANQNSGTGFYGNSGSGLNLQSGHFNYNGGRGIYLVSPTAGLVTDNQMVGNGNYGLDVSNVASTVFERNTVYFNHGSACDDANQSSGATNGWSGNYLETWCGIIPASH